MKKLVAVAAVGLSLAFAAPANAISTTSGTSVCSQLDRDSSPEGVFYVLIKLHGQGYSDKQAAEIVVSTVQSDCPNHLSDLKRFVQVYG